MLNQLSAERAAYLAGAIDGEGSLSIVPTNQARQVNAGFQARIHIANVQLEWLETLQAWIGAGSIQRSVSSFNTKRPCYGLRWVGPQAQHVLRQVFPYLLIKREQGTVLAEFFEAAAKRKATNVRWQASDPE